MAGLYATDASLNESSRRGWEPEDELWSVWFQAAQVFDLNQAIAQIYQRLDADVVAKQPVCEQSGRCCKFDSYGHRLYVTGLEIARFLIQIRSQDLSVISGDPPRSVLKVLPSDPPWQDSCVYQVEGLCSVHAVRPLGCRIFFCQAGTEDWQQTVYETHMRELRQLHETYDLPYRYMEWRAGLAQARASGCFGL